MAQLIAAVVAVAWALTTGLLLFNVLKRTVGLRASREEELSGLDLPEHGESTYTHDDAAPEAEPAPKPDDLVADRQSMGKGRALRGPPLRVRRQKTFQ